MEFCGTYKHSGHCLFSTEARLFDSCGYLFVIRDVVSLEGVLLATIQDNYQMKYNTKAQKRIALRGQSSAQDSMPMSSADDHSGSEISRLNILTRVASHSTCALNRCDDAMGASAVQSPQVGLVNTLENPGTPVRFLPGWQSQLGSPAGSHISFGSPGLEKGVGSYSPASLADQSSKGIPFQYRFLSGPHHGGIHTRPPPSKWDDAEKWIASPGHHESPAQPPLQRPPQSLPSGKRHSISGQSTQLNSGGGSPDFSTQHPIVKRVSTPLSSTIEEMTGSLESVNRSASSKQCSKALTFGEMSKKVFDLSCSNTSPTAAEKSTGNVGQRNHHGTDRKGVTDLDVRHESRCQVPEAPIRECAVPESLEDDNSKMTVNGRCLENLTDTEVLKHSVTVSTKEIGSHQVPSTCPPHLPPPSENSWRFGRRKPSSETTNKSSCTASAIIASPVRHNTPAAQSGRRPASLGSFAKAGFLELQTWHLAKLELSKLPSEDRSAAWTTREEEEMECSVSLRDSGVLEKGCEDDETTTKVDGEQTKRNGRCDKQAARISQWEEIQISRAEAEMQKLEMKIEKMRTQALEKMTNRIALARKKAKEMRATTHTIEKFDQAAKSVQHDDVASPIAKSSSFICCFKA